MEIGNFIRMEIQTDSIEEYIRAEVGRQRESVSWLAREVGMSRVALADRLNGVKRWHLDEIGAVAEALNSDPAALTALYFTSTTKRTLPDAA